MNEVLEIKKLLRAAFERFYYEGSKDATWQKETLETIARKARPVAKPLELPEVQAFLREWERLGYLKISSDQRVQVLKPGLPM